MTVATPQYIGTKGYTAQQDRQLLGDLFVPGVIRSGDLLVSSTGAALSVSVAAGAAIVAGTQIANQGSYRCFNDAALTVALDPAATNPRHDQIIARVQDSTVSGAVDSATVEVSKGSESSTASLANTSGVASLPVNSIVLADVLVPVGAGQVIPAANILDRRGVANPGRNLPIGMLLPWVGTSDPGGGWVLSEGRLIDRTTYATFYAFSGHSYNSGVDPGGNKVRIPDKRGRTSFGADNMGTAGAAGRLTANATMGSVGGTERMQLTASNLPALGLQVARYQETTIGASYQLLSMKMSSRDWVIGPGGVMGGDGQTSPIIGVDSTLQNSSFSIMPPFQTDTWIVRIA